MERSTRKASRIVLIAAAGLALVAATAVGCSHKNEPNAGVYQPTPTVRQGSSSSGPDKSSSTTAPSTTTPWTLTTVANPGAPGNKNPTGPTDPTTVDLHNPAAVASSFVCNFLAHTPGETSDDLTRLVAPLSTPQLVTQIADTRMSGYDPEDSTKAVPMDVRPWFGDDGSINYYVWCATSSFSGDTPTAENPYSQGYVTLAKQHDGTWRVGSYSLTETFVQPPGIGETWVSSNEQHLDGN